MSKNDMKLNSFQRDEALVVTDYSNKYAEWPHVGNSTSNKTIQFSPTPSSSNTETYVISPTSSPAIDSSVHDRLSITSSSPSILKKKGSISSPINDMEPNIPPVPAIAPIPPRKSPIQNVKKAAATKRRDSKSMNRIPSETDVASLAGTPNKDEDIYKIPISTNPFDTILSRAEGFLENVKKTVKKATSPDSVSHSISPYPSNNFTTKSIDGSKTLDGNPHQRLFSFPDMNADSNFSTLLISSKIDPTPNLTQIDWLIRGIPEAYEEDFEIDDEAVEKLLKEGGNPPSQLVFPSYHASSQRKMAKFKDARFLYINLTHFLIYSARYGVRRDCTHIAIRPPLGCTLPANQLASVLIPLTELDPNKEERKRKKSLLGDYFVGDCIMDENAKFPILLDDVIISKWMDAKEEGCLRIELYSYMVSPNSSARQSLSANPVCFGYINIPLAGLLCTETLDAVVNCDIQVEADTHASVISRMRSMPYSNSIDFSKPLGMKMGSLSIRLSILSSSEEVSAFKKVTDVISPLLIPQYGETNPYPMEKANDDKKKEINVIDSALAYTPVELLIDNNVSMNIDSVAFFGAIIYDVQLNSTYDPTDIIISYKISKEIREELSLENVINKSQYAVVRINEINHINSWSLPAFEVWIASTDEKTLLGLGKFDIDVQYGEIITVPIICIKTAKSVGRLTMSLHMHDTRDKIDNNVFNIIVKRKQQLISIMEEEVSVSPPIISVEPSLNLVQPVEPDEITQNMNLSIDTNVSIDSLNVTNNFQIETTSSTTSIYDISDEAQVQFQNIIASIDDDDSRVNSKLEDMEAMLKIVSDRINSVDVSSSSPDLDEESLITLAETILQEHSDRKVYELEIVNNDVKRNIPSSSSARLLDIIIEGTSDILDDSETCLGFYVTYTLPSIFSNNLTPNTDPMPNALQYDHKLWWDNKCSVLNTTNRHKFDVPSILSDDISGEEFIIFHIISCDDEGILSTDSSKIGTASLRVEELTKMLSSGSVSRLYNLEISFHRFATSSALSLDTCRLTLNISHRIEPTLLRSSTSKLVSESVRVNNLAGDITSDEIRAGRQGFIVAIEEVTNLPSDVYSKDSMLLITGTVGFTNSIIGTNSLGTYIPGAEAFITSAQKAGKSVTWSENQEIWVHKPDLSESSYNNTDNKCRWLRDATLAISLHIRQSWPLPFMYDTPSGFERPFTADSGSNSILKVGDQVLGSSTIDLSPFSFGMPCINGWYHIVDNLHQQKGQIKISIHLKDSASSASDTNDNIINDSNIITNSLINDNDDSNIIAPLVDNIIELPDISGADHSDPTETIRTIENVDEVKIESSDNILESYADDESKVSDDSIRYQQQQYSESKSYLYEDESKEFMSSSSSSSSSSSGSSSIILYRHEDDEYENGDDSNLEDKTATFVEPYTDNYNPNYYVNNDSNDALEYDVVEDDYGGTDDINEDYIDDFEVDDDSSYNDTDEVDGDDGEFIDDVNSDDNDSNEGDITESLYSNKDDIISSSSSSSLPHGTMVSDTSSELLVANEVLLSDESSSSIEITRRNDTSGPKNNLNDSSIISVKNQSLNTNNIIEDNDNDDNSDMDDEVEMESLHENSHNYNTSVNDKTEESYFVSEYSLSSYKYSDDKDPSQSQDITQCDNNSKHSNDLSISIETVREGECLNIENTAAGDEYENHDDIKDLYDNNDIHQESLVINTSLIESADSPLTSKIRRVVDQELSKIATLPRTDENIYNVIDSSNNNIGNENNTKNENNENHDDVINYNDDSMVYGIPTTLSIINSNNEYDSNLADAIEILKDEECDNLSPNNSMISKVTSIAEFIVKNTSKSNNKRPGRQRQFIDAETERVSKIMLSKFFKK